MKRDFNSLLFLKLFINLRKEPVFDFTKCSIIRNIDMIWCSYGRFFIYLTDKVDEPEKTTGPSGVISIAGSKTRVYFRDSSILYLAFIIF